jgi:hypothetical protein
MSRVTRWVWEKVTHYISRPILCQNLHVICTVVKSTSAKICCTYFCNFTKTATSKQLPNCRKFAQSGHPARAALLFPVEIHFPKTSIGFNRAIRFHSNSRLSTVGRKLWEKILIRFFKKWGPLKYRLPIPERPLFKTKRFQNTLQKLSSLGRFLAINFLSSLKQPSFSKLLNCSLKTLHNM